MAPRSPWPSSTTSSSHRPSAAWPSNADRALPAEAAAGAGAGKTSSPRIPSTSRGRYVPDCRPAAGRSVAASSSNFSGDRPELAGDGVGHHGHAGPRRRHQHHVQVSARTVVEVQQRDVHVGDLADDTVDQDGRRVRRRRLHAPHLGVLDDDAAAGGEPLSAPDLDGCVRGEAAGGRVGVGGDGQGGGHDGERRGGRDGQVSGEVHAGDARKRAAPRRSATITQVARPTT